MATQLFTTTDGINCRLKNPSFDNIGKYPPLDIDNKNWQDFEATVKRYSIHSDNPPIGEFWGEVVKRVRSRNPHTNEWHDWGIVNDYVYENQPADHYYWDKQEAVQPVPVKGEVKVEGRQAFEDYPKLAECLLFAANNWKVDLSSWSATLEQINIVCKELTDLKKISYGI